MAFFTALGGICGLLLIVGLGYALAQKGWFPPDTRTLLPRLVTNIALPPYLMGTIVRSFDRDNLLQLIASSLLPLGGLVLVFLLALTAAKIFRVERRHFGLFCACVSNSNTVFIGIPVNLALFGEGALHYALLYYFGSTLFFWTAGNYAIRQDARNPQAKRFSLRQNIRRFFSAPIMGFFTGLAVVGLDVSLPSFLMDAITYVGNLTTPLALIFVGIALQGINLRALRITRDLALALFGRLVFCPLVFFLLLPLFSIPDLMRKVFIMQSALPVLTQAAILSAYYKTDPEFGSLMVSLSTVLSAVTIPLYMVLL